MKSNTFVEEPFSSNTVRALLTIVWIVALSPIIFMLVTIIAYHCGISADKPVVYSFSVNQVMILGYTAMILLNIIYVLRLKYHEKYKDIKPHESSEFSKDLF